MLPVSEDENRMGISFSALCSVLALLATIRFRANHRRKEAYRLISVKPQHLNGIVELARNTYGGHDWIVREFFSWFSQDCIVLGLAHESSNTLAGLYVMRPMVEDGVGCLEALRVHPNHRGRGLGHRLQREMISRVLADNHRFRLKTLRYTVYDENFASVKVAKQSGMQCRYRFPYIMMTEDEPSTGNEFLRRAGKGAIMQFHKEICARSVPNDSSPTVNRLTNVQDVHSRLQSIGCKLLYQDWKPYNLTMKNLTYLMDDKHHEVYCDSTAGMSMGMLRKEENEASTICLVTHYFPDQPKEPGAAARSLMNHLDHWLTLAMTKRGLSSFYCSYPMEAYEELVEYGLVRQGPPQCELIMEMDL